MMKIKAMLTIVGGKRALRSRHDYGVRHESSKCRMGNHDR
jgi:hypothetical protein